MPKKGLKERLANGGTIVCAEGYLLEFERRGYMQAGSYFPEVVLEHPEIVSQLHEEFAHAGSDVIVAFTFYGNREKMRALGREDEIEKLNRDALRMAKEVADRHGCLMAGNVCNTGLYLPEDQETIRGLYTEQVQWAKEEGADFIVAETFKHLDEAMLALEVCKEFGIEAALSISPHWPDTTADGIPLPLALKALEDNGAAVVGLNCGRGPATMMPLMKEVRKTCKGPISTLPIVYRTDDAHKAWHGLKDPDDGSYSFPENLQCHQCSSKDIRKFAEDAKALGIQYIGLCCGNAANMTREVAEVYGRKPPASKYRPDMTHSLYLGDESLMPEKRRKLKIHLRGEDKATK